MYTELNEMLAGIAKFKEENYFVFEKDESSGYEIRLTLFGTCEIWKDGESVMVDNQPFKVIDAYLDFKSGVR